MQILKKHDKESWLPRKLFNKIRTGGDTMEIVKKFYDQSLKFSIEARNGFNEILSSSGGITAKEDSNGLLSLQIICSNIDHDKLVGLNLPFECSNPAANKKVIFNFDLTVEVAYLFISCFDLNPYHQSGFCSNDHVILNLRRYHDRFCGIKKFDRAFKLAQARNYQNVHVQSILPVVKDVATVIKTPTSSSTQGDIMTATNESNIETQSETSSSQVELEINLLPQQEVEQQTSDETVSEEPVIDYYGLVRDTINLIAIKSRNNFGIEFTAQMYAYIFVANKPKDLSVDQVLGCLDGLTARQLFEISEILNFDNCIAVTTDNWLADFCTHLVELTGVKTYLKTSTNDKNEFEKIMLQLSSISHRLSNLEYQNHRSGLEVQGASSDDRFRRSHLHSRGRSERHSRDV